MAETYGGEIVGFAGGGPEREGDRTYRGELYAVYLRQEHQRRGTGRLLASAVARGLLSAGFDSMLLWVLEDNRAARRFYESLGGEQVGRKTIAVGGAGLVEVSYGWRDITGLAGGHVGQLFQLIAILALAKRPKDRSSGAICDLI